MNNRRKHNRRQAKKGMVMVPGDPDRGTRPRWKKPWNLTDKDFM